MISWYTEMIERWAAQYIEWTGMVILPVVHPLLVLVVIGGFAAVILGINFKMKMPKPIANWLGMAAAVWVAGFLLPVWAPFALIGGGVWFWWRQRNPPPPPRRRRRRQPEDDDEEDGEE